VAQTQGLPQHALQAALRVSMFLVAVPEPPVQLAQCAHLVQQGFTSLVVLGSVTGVALHARHALPGITSAAALALTLDLARHAATLVTLLTVPDQILEAPGSAPHAPPARTRPLPALVPVIQFAQHAQVLRCRAIAA